MTLLGLFVSSSICLVGHVLHHGCDGKWSKTGEIMFWTGITVFQLTLVSMAA